MNSKTKLALAVALVWSTRLLAVPSGNADAAPELPRIFQAIRRADLAELKRLSRTPEAVDARDTNGDTVLMGAARLGDPAAIRVLLEAGADPRGTNAAGATALHRAAADPRKVALLLEHGSAPDASSSLGITPLMLAARCPESTESVRLLLSRGANVNARTRHGATALMAAAAAGNLEAVTLLVDRGADLDAVPFPEEPGTDPIWGGMRTALMWAAYRGDEMMVKFLLDRGAKVNLPAGFGTPLSQAAWSRRTSVARLLLDRGADIRQAEPFTGFTPLHWAASAEDAHPELASLLLQRGADPNAAGGENVDAFLGIPQSPLMLARKRGETEVVNALLSAGAKDEAGPARTRSASAARADHLDRDALDPEAIRSAISRALPPLQRTALRSRESFVRHASKQACASCHQQYFPMAAVGLARDRAIDSDRTAAAELIRIVREFHVGSELDAEPLFHPEPTHTYGYALLGLRAERADRPEASDALVHHLASIQHLDGHWDLNIVRPPLQSSSVSATALGVYTLSRFGWQARAGEFAARVERARAWLLEAKPSFHEERVFQILGLTWAGMTSEQLRPMLDALVAEQRGDGGWAQLPGLPTDSYATGQALYAIRTAGATGERVEAGRRAARFLLATQAGDGTWQVRRRAFPFQPTMESGFPYGRDGWISATGTSWAVMALSLMLDDTGPSLARSTQPRHQTPSNKDGLTPNPARSETPAPAVASIDFARQIQPLLERSCAGCHSGPKAKSSYRVTSRESLVGGGNLGEPAIIPGNSADSPLMSYLAGMVADMEMPPRGHEDRYPPLTADEIERVRAWIDQGASWAEQVARVR